MWINCKKKEFTTRLIIILLVILYFGDFHKNQHNQCILQILYWEYFQQFKEKSSYTNNIYMCHKDLGEEAQKNIQVN